MEVFESKEINEKYYKKVLDNGLEIIVFPKQNTKNKYVIWMTKYGSNISCFKNPKTGEFVRVPDGVAHFLEHKMFEQADGTNSLDTLTSIGVSANAYTCSTHTAYLFDGIDNFDEALTELMDYVQNPYFTPENVEKEKGIIGQEIQMYDDDLFWKTYFNLLNIMYNTHPLKIDTAGTKESIDKITDQTLYLCYNTFYSPNNMSMILVGDVNPETIFEEVEKKLTPEYVSRNLGKIEKEKIVEKDELVDQYVEHEMSLTIPMFLIGIKLVSNNDLNITKSEELVKREVGVNIINHILIGKASKLFNELYDEGKVFETIDFDYDYSDDFAYIIYNGSSFESKQILERLKKEIQSLKENGIDESEIDIVKKYLYGNQIRAFENVRTIARNITQSRVLNIDVFDYIKQIQNISKQDIEEILNRDFDINKMALSVTNPKKN